MPDSVIFNAEEYKDYQELELRMSRLMSLTHPKSCGACPLSVSWNVLAYQELLDCYNWWSERPGAAKLDMPSR